MIKPKLKYIHGMWQARWTINGKETIINTDDLGSSLRIALMSIEIATEKGKK